MVVIGGDSDTAQPSEYVLLAGNPKLFCAVLMNGTLFPHISLSCFRFMNVYALDRRGRQRPQKPDCYLELFKETFSKDWENGVQKFQCLELFIKGGIYA